MKDKIVCPICGGQLSLAVRVNTSWSKKIKKDGTLHKVVNTWRGEKTDNYFLECNSLKCGFIYNLTNKNKEQKKYELLDKWFEGLEDDIH